MRNLYILVLLIPFSIKAQNTSLINTDVFINDTVIICLNDYIGTIQWQQSTDSINWTNIDDAKTDSLLFIVEEDNYIRALVTVGNCEPFISSIAKISAIEDHVTDIDDNEYKVVKIGNQFWMAENLRVTHYPDGTPIPKITDDSEWSQLGDNNTDDAFCWYNNDSSTYAQTYGALYTWAAAVNKTYSSQGNPSGIQGVCPDGWHLPSNSELHGLYLLRESIKDSVGWSNNGNGTNEYGFSALPAGVRGHSGGAFYKAGDATYWMSSTENEYNSSFINYNYMHYSGDPEPTGPIKKSNGISVRCIKGEAISYPPSKPSLSLPENGVDSLPRFLTLKWSCSDPENDKISYDVYFDDIDASTIVSSNQSDTIYTLETLEYNTTYYWKIIARDGHGNETIGDTWSFTITPDNRIMGTMTDIDGNVYVTAQIGNQTWMAENLRVTHYADGSPIPIVNNSTQWSDLIADGLESKACCWWQDDSTNYHSNGIYYTWAAAMNGANGSIGNPSGIQGVCPDGWHLPSDSEWYELLNYVELDSYEGKTATALKSWNGWIDDGNGTDEYGFNAYPYGHRNTSGDFYYLGRRATWWSSKSYGAYSDNFIYYDIFASSLSIWYPNEVVQDIVADYYSGTERLEAVSVRCLKGVAISYPPNLPVSPNPQDGKDSAKIAHIFSWSCSDPENDALLYDVYIDTIDGSTLLFENLDKNEVIINILDYSHKYYWKVVARDSHGNETIGDVWTFSTEKDNRVLNTVTDIDGNVYTTVVIGNQEWMIENLRTTHYADGTPIPTITDTTSWSQLVTSNSRKAYCWYNDSVNYYLYGAYYSWQAAMDSVSSSNSNIGVKGVCPDGWHLPSTSEWKELVNHIENNRLSPNVAVALKSKNKWPDNQNGTNEFGFNGHPYGSRLWENFLYYGSFGQWWSSTKASWPDNNAYSFQIWPDNNNPGNPNDDYSIRMWEGINVRCVKD